MFEFPLTKINYFETKHESHCLTDEDFELDLTEYQAQAVIYYLKAKMAEEMMS
mgnify:CR=1 FL=1